MEQKTKYSIIALISLSVIFFFLFVQGLVSQQQLARERNDLKGENTTLTSKISELENKLNKNQNTINSLKVDLDKANGELSDLQNKFDLASKAREELIEKLKSQRQESKVAQPEIVLQNTDAYWGAILKTKTDLEMQLSSIRVELRSLQINNESLQRDKATLELDVTSLRNEKQDLQRQLDYNQKILDTITQEVVRERNDKVKIQDSFKVAKNNNTVFLKQLETLSHHKTALDRKLQSLQIGKETVEKRLAEMETMLTKRIAQIDSLKEELDAIRTGKPSAALESRPKESVELPEIVVRSTNAAQKDNVDESVFSGKILAINPENNFVVIDLGASSRVKHGDVFSVYRDGDVIGSIAVIQARENISACDIKNMSRPLRIGDNIK